MRLLSKRTMVSTRTVQMRPLSTRTMQNEVAKHKKIEKFLSTRTIANKVNKHKNNANEAVKQKNDAK